MTILILAILSMIAMRYHSRLRFGRGRGISILIPFQSLDPQRRENYQWLKRYWRAQLPGAEIITGRDINAIYRKIPFSKSVAVNDARSQATGDILAIIDADGYVDADSVLLAAKRIRKARKRGHKLWFVPYRRFFRLGQEAARRVLDSSPKYPYRFPTPPAPEDVQETGNAQVGHWYGAMAQILPKEAFDTVGGWDVRFRGWGGEDHAAMRATDTLYGPHKTLDCQVLHLWHPMRTPDGQTSEWVHWKYRTWAGQTEHSANDALSGRYYGATGHPTRMRSLVDEGLQVRFADKHKKHCECHHHHKKHKHCHCHCHCRPSV